MTHPVTVAIPFVRVDAGQNPNIRSAGNEHVAAYFRAMTVAFAAVRRLHPDARLELISNAGPLGEFRSVFSGLGVEARIVPFNHRPPEGFAKVFEGSLFLLDALDHLSAGTTVLIDPDVLLVRPLDALLKELDGRVGAVRIDYSRAQNINGLSRTQAMELHGLLDAPVPVPQQHMGGEFYVIPEALAEVLRRHVASAWELSLDRFAQGRTYFTTEEHVLSYALRAVPLLDLNEHVRRVWTAHSFRNVSKEDAGLTAWHLPAEKDRGFAEMYPLALDKGSWFWQADQDVFVARAAKMMGMYQRRPRRLALDAAGHAARWARELRTPASERAAG